MLGCTWRRLARTSHRADPHVHNIITIMISATQGSENRGVERTNVAIAWERHIGLIGAARE